MLTLSPVFQTDTDLCNPNPCENDAHCYSDYNNNNDYYCQCPEGLHGKNCSETKAVCLGPQCDGEYSSTGYISRSSALLLT